MRLENKVIIITGAAQGMGKAHAELCLQEGAKVVLTDLNEEKGQETASALGDNALFIPHDVTSEEDWARVIEETKNKWGRIDCLVNNAGITINTPIEELTVESYKKILEINQVSTFLGMKAVTPIMKEQKDGDIINISSLNGLVGGAFGYTETKFAVRGAAKAAVRELAHHNIRVNSIHPGVIDTPMIHQGDTADTVAEFAKFIPMRRIADPIEVSHFVVFLASDECRYSTGSEFVIDGGLSAL